MKIAPRRIELLSPAKDLACGIEAIRCGADAVYIGAPHFGARAAAGNSVDDIAQLVAYAHQYGVHVYATMNTIIFDDELEEARMLALKLHEVGVDALITQDMALQQMNLPIPLNASTQMDNRTPEHVNALAALGFKRVILARELSLDEIKKIRHATDIELEVFVHGALCVSYSGRCYASQHCFGRSANRGTCAQVCRLAYDLVDVDGNVLVRQKHLLSLKDLNRSRSLEALMDAGVASFKIEGRLKDVAYVKNVTAFYRQKIDEILSRRPEYRRASYGHEHIDFQPCLEKSFNRGFTDYFLRGRTEDVSAPDTPKSVGEPVGHVKAVRGREIKVGGLTTFHNGDGLCYFDSKGRLQGFRVNRVEGNVLHLSEAMPEVPLHAPLYRNYDAQFVNLVSKKSDERTIMLDIVLTESDTGFLLSGTDETGRHVQLAFPDEKQTARTPQRDRVVKELSKLGGTCYEAGSVNVEWEMDYFLPAARVAGWRRALVEKLLSLSQPPLVLSERPSADISVLDPVNVANRLARQFYEKTGDKPVPPAYELHEPKQGALLMTCKHCVRYSLGACNRHLHNRRYLPEPLYLQMADGRRFRLSFDCQQCEMHVYDAD
ncbi:MAG: U32 family peptidase [Bacteroidaceae bacterium]|nr:U32 family peptidase [Bacteroidaceae bacterium]